jgi:hypothetical protein
VDHGGWSDDSLRKLMTAIGFLGRSLLMVMARRLIIAQRHRGARYRTLHGGDHQGEGDQKSCH